MLSSPVQSVGVMGQKESKSKPAVECPDTSPDEPVLEKPTLLDLMEMKGADGKSLRVIQTIAAGNYNMFGMYLLQDKNGTMVDLIEKDHIIRGAASVTQAILQKWLTSDAPTRTYQHLIECLRQSELGALAELIRKTIVEQGMFANCA